MSRDRGPMAPARPLIPIEAGSGPAIRPSAKSDPYQFYLEYFRGNDRERTDPDKLAALVQDLNELGRFRDVHAALRGYLIDHPKLAEPWMYEALAWSISLNQGSPADVKTALNYAADLAQRSHNPNHLFSAADKLMFKGYYERVGALLDETMSLVPHRAQPIVMSINLAQKTTDPKRMADSIERLLSLGWPGEDEYFRIESRNQVEKLAKTLREANRDKEADALLEHLTASLARDVFVRLTWDGEADYDLAVHEPLGVTASYDLPRTVFGGSVIANGYGSHPEEVYVCPRGFNGEYQVGVKTIFTNPDKPVTRLTLEIITHEGTAQEKKETFTLDPDKPGKPVTVKLTGGRRTKVLPFVDPLAITLPAAAASRNKGAPAAPARGGRAGANKPGAALTPPAQDTLRAKP